MAAWPELSLASSRYSAFAFHLALFIQFTHAMALCPVPTILISHYLVSYLVPSVVVLVILLFALRHHMYILYPGIQLLLPDSIARIRGTSERLSSDGRLGRPDVRIRSRRCDPHVCFQCLCSLHCGSRNRLCAEFPPLLGAFPLFFVPSSPKVNSKTGNVLALVVSVFTAALLSVTDVLTGLVTSSLSLGLNPGPPNLFKKTELDQRCDRHRHLTTTGLCCPTSRLQIPRLVWEAETVQDPLFTCYLFPVLSLLPRKPL